MVHLGGLRTRDTSYVAERQNLVGQIDCLDNRPECRVESREAHEHRNGGEIDAKGAEMTTGPLQTCWRLWRAWSTRGAFTRKSGIRRGTHIPDPRWVPTLHWRQAFSRVLPLPVPVDRTRIETALEWAQLRAAPDLRVACFEVDWTERDQRAVLSGVVESKRAKELLVESVDTAVSRPVEADDVVVLPSDPAELTTTRSEVPVRSGLDPAAERVTSVVYGMSLHGYDKKHGWRRVRVPDGYLGWVPEDALELARAVDVDRVLVRDVETDQGSAWLPAGVRGAYDGRVGDDIALALRTGERVRVPDTDVARIDGPVDPEQALAAADRYSGTSYRWGGMTTDGIDCSGLVWMAYWQTGLRLPRDSDQQRRVGTEVSREALESGDLLFFPGHVALSLGGDEFIHASGSDNAVTVGSLDPEHDRYVPDRAAEFELAKRLVR